jgi:lipopolysaccharide biosynthesis glycosyltransferase
VAAGQTLEVACAAERRYAPHSAAMLHSVLEHSPLPVRVHYLHGPSFPAASARRLAWMVRRHGGEISFVEVPDERIAGLPVDELFTSAMWYRILLPELAPDADRVLYLDVDTIAVDDLGPLWETELGDAYLGAVTNVFFKPEHRDRVAALGLDPERYFNSGVLLCDLARMRADGCTERLLTTVRDERRELEWPDQDALNLVYEGRRADLHPRWNCMNSVMRFEWTEEVFGPELTREARSRPGIRHFEGPEVEKPWHLMCERAGRELYFRHRRRTPWPIARREGVTLRNVARRARRLVARRRGVD